MRIGAARGDIVPFVDEEGRGLLEAAVRAQCDAGDYDAAAAAAIRGYGPELLGFLVGVHASETDGADAFAEVCEILWRKLPDFAWGSTLRTWSYGIAKNVARTHRRDAARRRRRENPVGESALDEVVRLVRSDTISYLRTQQKTRLLALRDALDEEDRMLLILRVDRRLEWNDLVRVLAEGEGLAAMDDASVKKEAARLRKRFQILKERLREAAKREGLIE
jgi:RNA polymerase sigma-70 factor (ECF subfamily)